MAPIVIIGGGIIGCAILHELTKQGLDVILLEAGWIAGGTTGQSGGYVRTFQTDLTLTEYSIAYYKNLPSFTQTGMEYVLEDGNTYYEADAGRIDTIATCRYWVKGCDYRENIRVLEVLHTGGTITALRTNHGIMPASFVILAAGTGSINLIPTPTISNKWFQYISFTAQVKPLMNFKKDYFCFPIANNTSIAGFLNKDKIIGQINTQEAKQLNDLLDLRTSYNIHLACDSFSSIESTPTYNNLLLTTAYNAGAIKIAPAIAKRTLLNNLQALTVRR